MSENNRITVKTIVNAPVEKVWNFWTDPEHIVNWNNASDDWHTTKAENDLKVGGEFSSRMEAKDGSMGFDFSGKYTEVKNHELIAYEMEDGRKVEISFLEKDNEQTEVVEAFDAENENDLEMQRAGWQAILENFKKYVEEY